jgi:adenine-specific DNA-methyltransferase
MRPEIDHVAGTSADPNAERIEQLKDLIPEAFSEGRIDFQRLREALGDIVDDRPERYSFTWAGRRDALRLLQTPSRATLLPSREESVDWDTTENLYIEGDNLEVLKLMYKSYAGTVKVIYIDPPYNKGKDFIYPDNFSDPLSVYLKLSGQTDETGNWLNSNPESSGRFHSSWLSMIQPRLFLARQLLREDGAIFVSIDDREVHNLRVLMNEVFGEENFIATVIWQRVYAPKNTAKFFSEDHDYVVVYARNAECWKPHMLPRSEESNARYANPDNDPRGDWKAGDMTARNYYSLGQYEVTSPSGKTFSAPRGRYWSVNKERFDELDEDGRIWWGETGSNMPASKQFLSEVRQGIIPQTLWGYKEVGHTQAAKKELLQLVPFEDTTNVFDTPKPTRLIQRILQIATSPSAHDIVLDFFAGSASTGHAVYKQNQEDGGNRLFICVQIPEPLPVEENELRTISDIAKSRLRASARKVHQASDGKLDMQTRESPEDLGFRVFKLAESNFQSWAGVDGHDADTYAETMALFNDTLHAGSTAIDAIYEIILREGFSLVASIEQRADVTTNVVYTVTDPELNRSFLVCLDPVIEPATVEALALTRDILFICRDSALTDELAANLALQCRLKTL